MAKKVKSLIRAVHGYAGAVLALIFIVMGLSGAALVFEEEMLKAAHAELRSDSSIDIFAATDAIVAEYGASRIAGLKLPQEDFPAFRLGLKNGRKLIVDGAGGVVADIKPFSTFTGTLADLHMHWFAGSAGKFINGIFAAVLGMFAATGLIVWPRRGFRWRSFAPRRLDPPSLHALHRNLGVLVSPFVLLAAVTAFGVIFSSQLSPLLQAVAGRPTTPAAAPEYAPASGPAVSDAMRAALGVYPDARIAQVQPAATADAVHKIRMTAPGEINAKGYTRINVSAKTGAIEYSRDARAGGWNEKLMESLLPLHSGHTGWPGHKIIAGLTGLALAGLAAAGFAGFWMRRLRKKRAS